MAPLGARAADLVVWWEKGYYAEEGAAVREIIAAFEQESGKQVELVFQSRRAPDKIEAALEAGQPPDFAFGFCVNRLYGVGPRRSARGSHRRRRPLLGPVRSGWARPVLLLNAGPARGRCTGCRSASTNYLHVWKSLLEQAGFTSRTSPRSGMRSGRSGATRCSPLCAGPRAATKSGASASTCRAGRRDRRSILAVRCCLRSGLRDPRWPARHRRPEVRRNSSGPSTATRPIYRNGCTPPYSRDVGRIWQ